MKKLIVFLIMVSLIFPVVSSLNYKVDLDYSDYEFSVSNVEIDYFSEQSASSGNYSILLIDHEKILLYTYYFDFNTIVNMHYVDADTGAFVGQEVELSNFDFSFVLPYFSNVTSLEIRDDNLEKIGEYDLGEFSSVSLGGVEDIFDVDEVLGDEPEAGSLKSEESEDKSVIEKLANNLWILVVVIVVLLVIFLYTLFRKKKKY